MFTYVYDFGDYWEHEVTLENSRYFNPDLRSELACLKGERACAPDDVGGVPGYQRFCEILKDPSHEEYDHMMAWSGGNYDSEKFDRHEVNCELMKFLCWSRDRYLLWD